MKQVLRTLALLCAMLLLVGGVSFATSTVESWGPFTFYSNSERSLVTSRRRRIMPMQMQVLIMALQILCG